MNIIITTGSITSAVRLRKRLNLKGDMNASVIHTPSAINNSGCSYSVKTSHERLSLVMRLKQEGKINFRKIYEEDVSGGESVYRDISG